MADFTEITNKDENGNTITLATLLSKINTALSNMDEKINVVEKTAKIMQKGFYNTYKISELLGQTEFSKDDSGKQYSVDIPFTKDIDNKTISYSVTHGTLIERAKSLVSDYMYEYTHKISQYDKSGTITYCPTSDTPNRGWALHGNYSLNDDGSGLDITFTFGHSYLDSDDYPVKLTDSDTLTVELY